MGLKSDLETRVDSTFRKQWTTRDGTVVPDDTSIKLDNDGVRLSATILYADLRESTAMVDTKKDWFAAEIYKNFLYCAARIVASETGTVTSYDGDRIMAVYIGTTKNTQAVRTGLKLAWAVDEIIKPSLAENYPNTTFDLRHTVGIDTSPVLVAKTGARGANDLVWVGRAANYAAKLSDLKTYRTYITGDVFDAMNEEVKTTGGKAMWDERKWTAQDNLRIYGSTWRWKLT